MHQELWRRAKSQVLPPSGPVCVMPASAPPQPSDLQAALTHSDLTLPRSPIAPRNATSRTRASSHTPAFTHHNVLPHSHSRENPTKHDVNNGSSPESLANLNNPLRASRRHQELHKELLLAHKKGLVVCCKPELQTVLERRSRERSQREEGEQSRSPLEQVLLKRQQQHLEREKEEEVKVREDAQLLEFVRVRQNLRKVHSAFLKTPNS